MDYIYNENPIEKAAQATAKLLTDHLLNGERVLWLLSGGSSLNIAIEASKKILGINLSNLSVSLTDERYGPIGHANENWQQLIDGGLWILQANIYRPIIGKDIKETEEEFNTWLENALKSCDYKLAIFGMGPDGHTAGIKPLSPATRSGNLVASFKGDDFERVTISFNAIKQLDEAVIQISGSDKIPELHKLIYEDIALEKQPAQILKTIPKSTIYSNIKQGEIL